MSKFKTFRKSGDKPNVKLTLLTIAVSLALAVCFVGLLWLVWPQGFGQDGVMAGWFARKEPKAEETDSRTGEDDEESLPFEESEEEEEDSFLESGEESEESKAPAMDFSFFKNAAFIGDTRTTMLKSTAGLNTGAVFSQADFAVDQYDGEEYRYFRTKNQEAATLLEVLSETQYERIYLMMGFNELTWDSIASFSRAYMEMVEAIQQIQPKAKIYLQSLLPVTEERSEQDEFFNNKRIAMFNDTIRQVAKTTGTVYLEVDTAIADAGGALPAEYASGDGIRFGKKLCVEWLKYLEKNS